MVPGTGWGCEGRPHVVPSEGRPCIDFATGRSWPKHSGEVDMSIRTFPKRPLVLQRTPHLGPSTFPQCSHCLFLEGFIIEQPRSPYPHPHSPQPSLMTSPKAQIAQTPCPGTQPLQPHPSTHRFWAPPLQVPPNHPRLFNSPIPFNLEP